jgi:hypothetical protein
MIIATRTIRLARFLPSTGFAVLSNKSPCRISTPLSVNSSTAASQPSQVDGNSAPPPKQMSQIGNLKLNDGNEIPLVSHLFHFGIEQLANRWTAGLRSWDCSIQGRSKCTYRQGANQDRRNGYQSWVLPLRRCRKLVCSQPLMSRELTPLF